VRARRKLFEALVRRSRFGRGWRCGRLRDNCRRLGEGGEQNAPLGRAVIGGLFFATIATLFFVPTVFSILRRQKRTEVAVLSSPSELPEQNYQDVPEGTAVSSRHHPQAGMMARLSEVVDRVLRRHR
jgi:hypothetical protein